MKNIKYIGILGLALFLQSCFVAKDYNRPEQVVNEKLYRTDQLSQDSLSMANVSWKEIFTDQKLAAHIEKGLSNNLDIRIALQNIEAAQAYVKQGKAAYFPTITGNASYTHSTQSMNTQFGALIGQRQFLNQYELSGSLSWEADIWGKIRSNQRAFVASYLQSVSAHQAVKSELVASIASTYYQLLALDEQKRITEETITNRENSLETTKLLKDAGNVTEVAVKQTEAQLLNAKALLLDIDNNIKLMENSFSILLGESPQTIERGTLNTQVVNADMKTGVPIQLLSNRPDVMAAEYALINSFELTNVAKSNFYPAIRLTASGGLQGIEFDRLFDAHSLFGSVVASLAQPILNGRQIRTQYEVSKAQQETALLNYKKTILNASKEVSDAMYTFQTNDEKIKLKQDEFEAYNDAITFSEELQIYGMANYLEVLTARENALNAQLSVINTQYGRLNAIVQLYKAVGGGWK
ncbi:efflux transporter outer membrane subunit [Moheibacter sediminis]|uniref:Efflux transporter, outer membrane factor (OMF) lipoprotein, NodT family n=1 Tax=Moheibacter sediminis TaxID=1434700 RepID=A0A1W2BVQ2_9FLAO|nr:efflux transporter outer membrane subunit [Moheibacter sediminis]SMC77073.1 efflux transporter, outer membrane factor (OMF) lipoprotein, NodT family [Moheibacter sediminis]